MYDVVGKVAAFIAASLVFFVLTTTLYAQKQDNIVQDHVTDAVHEFVDTARTSGYITKTSYDTLINRLDATQNIYKIELTHYAVKTNYVSSGSSSFQDNYEAHNKTDILRALESQNGLTTSSPRYMMNKGDYIRIEVVNMHPTLSRKLMGIFLMGSKEGGQIRSQYGGYIGYDE